MKGCVRALAAGLGLAAALAVFAAAPAAAYYIKGPAFLAKSTLNGAAVTVSVDDHPSSEYFSQLSIQNLAFWTLSGVPAGATVTIASGADGGNNYRQNSPQDAILTLSFSGDFAADWDLSIRGATSLFNLSDNAQSFGSIRVRVSGGAGLRVGSVSGQATEAGGTATFPVRLWTQPSSAVTVSVSSLNTGEGTVEPASLVFTGGSSGNWNTAQTVTVRAVDDNVDDETVTWQVRLDPSSGDTGYNGLANMDVSVTTTDNDATATATLALNPSSITEGGGISTVTARLSRPTNVATTLTVSTAAVSPAVSGDFTQSGTILTVAAGATTSTGLVTVTAVDNAVVAANKSVTVSATAAGGRGVAAPSDVTLTITEDDFGLDVGSVSGQATEAGGTATFTVALLSQPSAAVTVAVSSRDTGEGTAGPSSLIFNTSNWNTAQTVTVTGVQDTVDDGTVTWQVRLDPSSSDGNYNTPSVEEDVSVTTTDDDGAPGVTLSLDPASVSENGGVATVTARLAYASGTATTVSVTAVSGAFTVGSGAAGVVVIPAGATTTTDTALVTAVDNTTDAPNRTATVGATVTNARAAVDSTTMAVTGATLTLTDDDAGPGVTLAVNPSSIAEPNGVSTVSATLSHPSSEPSTVTVTAVSGSYTAGTDATIVIAAGATTAASDTALIVVVNDDLHHGNAGRGATVTGALTNGQGAGAVTGAALTITDDETLPEASLVFSSNSISENGGVATITAQLSGLSGKSSEATTVTVSVAAVASSGAVSGDFTLSTATTLTVAAGARTSTGLVTVTAVDNNLDIGTAQKQLRVSGTTTGGNGIQNPVLSLLLIDDDDAAAATLVLTPSAILENGGISTVTATLSHPTTEAATLTVSTAPVSPTVATDFTQSSTTTLTIAANATTSAGLVTITAVDNNVATGNKQVRVSASASGGRGVSAPSAATLILRDDEFGLSESAVSGQATEAGGQATFTVRLNTQPSAAVTVAVTSRDASEGTVSPPSLVFAPGGWNTAQTVTVTGVQDTIDDGTVTWQVRLDPSSGDSDYNAVTAVDVDVTTTDDDGAPGVTLSLTPASVSENGGVATVTARLSHASGTATTVTVAAVSGVFTVGSGAAGTIVIPAGSTTAATDRALVTAVDNTTDAPDRTATVTATVTNARAAADSTTMSVTGATLTVRDDDAAPGVALAVNPASVAENGGVSTVTATLSGPSSQPSTVTVTAVSGSYGAGTDATIVIAAGSTTAASDTATVTAVDDDVHQGSAGRSVTVTAALANGHGAGAVTGASLALTDDETLPTLSLALGPSSVSENGGVSTVTAALSGPSSQPVTVTVGTAAVSSTGAVAGDFTQTGTTLTVAAGETTSAGLVTVRGNDNRVDAADKQVTVSAAAAGGNGVAAPSAATLTLTDDEATATASLVLTPRAILENEQVSTVTAVLSYPTTEAVTLTVSTAPVSPAVAADFTQSSTVTLTIAAGETTSAGVVTVQAHDNSVASGRKFVTVSATAAGGRGVAAPADARLTIRDDEYGLDLGAVSGRATEGGGRATFTVALQTQPSSAVTVAVTSRDAGEGTVSPSSLVFTTGNWSTARTVTARGVDDSIDDGDVVWRVRLDPSSGDANYDSSAVEEEVDVTTEDDDGLPTMSLVLLPSSIGENGGVSTVEARLSHGSGEAATVAVSFAAVAPAVAGDFTESAALTLMIAAEETSSTGLVTVTANDNTVVSPDKRVMVSGAATGGYGVASPPPVTLTIENDDEGGLALPSDVVTPTAGGAAAVYTVALTRAPADAVTVSVTRDNSDVTVDPSSLTFTMGNWNVAQPVTVTAALDTDTFPDAATLAHAASGGGYDGVTGTVAVAVDDRRVTGIPLGGAAVAGTKTYRVNRQLVTVTWPEAESVREDVVVFDLTGIDRAVEVTFAELSEGGAGAGYSLGPSAASRVALDIEVSPVPTGGLRQLCLRVPDGLREAARGRGLVLLRNGEPVAGSRDDPPNKRVCAAGVSSFSPFAVGYVDTKPVFPEFTMTSMVFTVNQAVETDPLPLAVGGDGTEHRLSPARLVERLEAVGVEFDRARRVFSGTPTKAFAEEEFTWTATDDDGDEAKPLKFTIAVKAALDDARARLTAINESVLPELSRAMWGSALDAVTGRLGGGGVPGAGGSAGLAGGLAAVDALLRANADKLEDGRASLRELLDGRSVALRLGASGSGESGAGSQGAVVWMSGDWRKLSRKQAGLDWSGDLFAAHVGADAALGPRLRGGIAASRYASAVTYTDGIPRTVESVGAAVVGVHRTRMTTATPYIGVTGDRARAWAALGLGGGRVEIDDAEVVNQRLGEQSSGARFAAAALGGSARLSSGGAVEVRVKASGETSRFTVRGNGEGGAIAPLAATAQRLRLSAEGSRTWALASGAELTPALEVGGRWDGGGGVTGAGIEIGGGVVWSDPGAGLTMEARARALVAHRGGAREHGVSAAVRLEPGARGRGLSLSLSPSWGKAESGMERLWRTGAPAAEAKPRSAPRLEAELGYGVPALGGSATLTPYGGFGIGEDGERRWRLGGRLELGQTFGLRLEAGHRDSPTTRPDNSIKLTLDARW